MISNQPFSTEPLPRVTRHPGSTPTERFLKTLCDHSFLSLWSYPNIFRDQKAGKGGDGKELCDVLVVFGDDILIFSDKNCEFPSTGDIALDWSRWYRRAIGSSAEQAWGAERWIREHPDRIFVDRACTQPFPLDLPQPDKMRFHHIVVAHNISDRCRDYFSGGSGTLMFDSDVTPASQSDRATCEPFKVGWFDPGRTFIHVLDDVSLRIVLRTRDTITDFLHYVRTKERFLRQLQEEAKHFYCAGEEELLAQYFLTFENDEHGFKDTSGFSGISIVEGDWKFFEESPERAAQLEADRISYAWDGLIEKFNENILGGTSYYASDPKIGNREKAIRFLAREPRVRRRMLAEALLGLLEIAKPTQRANRVIFPSNSGDPHYCLLLLPKLPGISYEEYREGRRQFLEVCCYVTKLVCPDALDIVALATENSREINRSEDALYFDARFWDKEMQEQAQTWQRDLGLLVNLTRFEEKVSEFPDVPPRRVSPPGPNPRNKPCPCGSGKKYKRCHGG
jgi:hypothetical protein